MQKAADAPRNVISIPPAPGDQFLFVVLFDSEESFGPDGISLRVLWRPEALDCRVLIPPEAWSWLTRNPPSMASTRGSITMPPHISACMQPTQTRDQSIRQNRPSRSCRTSGLLKRTVLKASSDGQMYQTKLQPHQRISSPACQPFINDWSASTWTLDKSTVAFGL
jgi:hypothetical protein